MPARVCPCFTTLSAALLVLASVTASGQQRVQRGWPLNANGAVKLFNDVGSIRVIGWDRDSVAVSGTAASTGTFFGGGDRTGVKFGVENAGGKPAGATDLVVYLPATARVWVRSASASVDVSNFSGALDASTVSGTVRINGSPVELRAESMNGALNITAAPAYLRLKSATGAITWNGSSDDVGITTVSGRVTVNAGTVQRARFESIDGEIRFNGGLGDRATMAIDTHSGNITLAFAQGTNARLDVNARGADLLGAQKGQERGASTPSAPKAFYQSVGKPTLLSPSIAVRTYKGYVLAGLQVASAKP